MEQISPIQALLQQRTLLQLEYYTEKEAFRKLTEQMGLQRKVKRGDAWFPLQVGKSFYNSLNQTAIEVFRTSDQDIEHNFEFGRPVMFFMVKKMGKNENQGNTALQLSENANQKVQSSNLKVQSNELPAFLANGDRAKVMKVSRRIDLYGFHFATLLLKFPDYDNYELEATVLLDTLTSEAPALTHDQQEQLFHKIEEDYQDIPLKADRMKAIRQDPYFNALQVKFAYAVTCHKAQGGQWSHVYVDQGYMTDDMLTPDYIHWLYTAFTRATEMLYLVNWPKTQVEGE